MNLHKRGGLCLVLDPQKQKKVQKVALSRGTFLVFAIFLIPAFFYARLLPFFGQRMKRFLFLSFCGIRFREERGALGLESFCTF